MRKDIGPKPYVVCSCGNLIDLGEGPLTPENQITREHPACGRKTTRLVLQEELNVDS